jgi:hypothetical protein
VEEEIYILEVALLKIPRGPLYNRCDVCDEESLREPTRLLGLVWVDKKYTRSTSGPAPYEKKRRHASRGFLGSCELCSYQRREGNIF